MQVKIYVVNVIPLNPHIDTAQPFASPRRTSLHSVCHYWSNDALRNVGASKCTVDFFSN